VTPNLPEAERLAGFAIKNEAGMILAAKTIRDLGVEAVLVKGGHLENTAEVVDVLDNQGDVTAFRGDRINGREVHGTGGILSAAITACLANGSSREESIRQARDYLTKAMHRAKSMSANARLIL